MDLLNGDGTQLKHLRVALPCIRHVPHLELVECVPFAVARLVREELRANALR